MIIKLKVFDVNRIAIEGQPSPMFRKNASYSWSIFRENILLQNKITDEIEEVALDIDKKYKNIIKIDNQICTKASEAEDKMDNTKKDILSLISTQEDSLLNVNKNIDAKLIDINEKFDKIVTQSLPKEATYNTKTLDEKFNNLKLSNIQETEEFKHFTKAEKDKLASTCSDSSLNKKLSDLKLSNIQETEAVKHFTAADKTKLTDAYNKASEALKNSFLVKENTTEVLFKKTAPAEFVVQKGLVVKVNDSIIDLKESYKLSLDKDLDIGLKTVGTDYYIFGLSSSKFVISKNKTCPVGSEKEDAKLIGGFHYGLTLESEIKTGNKTELDMKNIRGINSYSFWDLKFRPICAPEGMFFAKNKWYDIYLLNSEHITYGTSKSGQKIAAGVTSNARAIPKIPIEYGGDNSLNYGKLTWFEICEIAKSHGKELISYTEFPTVAYGVNEGKSSADGYETFAGKIEHYPQLTSIFGMEQATGVQWVRGSDVGGNRSENSIAWSWKDKTDGRGNIYSLHNNHVTSVLLGGGRNDVLTAGSRSSHWSNYLWDTHWDIGSRLSCDHMQLI